MHPALLRILRTVAAHPLATLALLLAASLPLLAAGAMLRPDNSVAVWFVEDDPALAEYRAFVSEFGNDEVVAIAYRAPGDALAAEEMALQARAAEAVAAVDGIDRVLSPAGMAAGTGTGPEARAHLRRAGVLSRDGRSAVLLARMEARDDVDHVRDRVLEEVRGAVAATLETGGRRARYAGIGVVYDALNRQTVRDSGFYLGVAFVVMAGLLWFALRRARAVAIAIVPPVVVSLMTMGLFTLTGRPFTQVTSILPMLVLVIGLSDALHLLSHYYAERRAAGPLDDRARRELVARSAAFIAWPNLFTALTTSAGFLALASSRMPAVRDLGLAAAAAMLLGWVMTLLVGTAALARWDVAPPPERAGGGAVDRSLAWLAAWVPRRRAPILLGMGAATAVLLLGATRVRVDTHTLALLPEGHTAREDSRWIEEEIGFYTPLEFRLRAAGGSAADPALLRRLAVWQAAAEERPEVGRTFGVAEAALAGGAEPGGAYLSEDGREARVTAFVPMTSTRRFGETVRALEDDARRVFGSTATLEPSGYLPLYLRIVEYVVSGTVTSLAISAGIVFAMLWLLLRSLPLTLAAVPANLFPVALVFGTMGWTGIPLDIATATIGAIVLGIAVDDTIHFLFRYREERRSGAGREEAVARTYREAGRPIVFATLVLALGFAVLATSGSQSIAYFGIVAALAIVGAMVADLVLLPVLLLLGGRT